MSPLLDRFRQTPVRRWVLYLFVYCTVGGILQWASPHLRIAAFLHDWQVFTLYGLFLVPLSLVLRGRPWHTQYAYALVAIAPVDVIGFAIGTSFAYPGNFIEHLVGPRSFTLTFVLCAGWIPVVGNFAMSRFEAVLFGLSVSEESSVRHDSVVFPLTSMEREGQDSEPQFPLSEA